MRFKNITCYLVAAVVSASAVPSLGGLRPSRRVKVRRPPCRLIARRRPIVGSLTPRGGSSGSRGWRARMSCCRRRSCIRRRETADGAYYVRAEAAAERRSILNRRISGAAANVLGPDRRTSFSRGTRSGTSGHRNHPARPDGIRPAERLADRILGDYEGAEKAVQKMVDLRPDLAALRAFRIFASFSATPRARSK